MRLRLWWLLALALVGAFGGVEACSLPSADEFSSCPNCANDSGHDDAFDGQALGDANGTSDVSDANGSGGDTSTTDGASVLPDANSVGRIPCGATSCTLGAKVCCTDSPFSCVDAAAACSSFRLDCDDRTDCVTSTFPTPVCCLPLSDAGVPIDNGACHGYNYCLTNYPGHLILCDPIGVDPCPPDAGTCKVVTALTKLNGAYYACQ